MPADTTFSDDYVAEILKRDAAKKDTNRFVASGLGSLLSGRSRPRSEAPKPNARFLKNLVRDVDSHNAALKEKEERESRKRMWDLQRGGKKPRSRSPTSESRSTRHENRDSKHRHRSRSRERDRHHDDGKRRRRSLERYAPGSSRHKRARSRSRSRSPKPRSKHRHRHRSPDSTSIPKQECLRKSERERSSPPPRPKPPSKDEDDSDSDPLEAIIGPQPPPRSRPRGRGAQNTSSTINDHFKPSYNPKTDVNVDGEEAEDRDDWDLALEAVRDRAKWKQSGAERLRAAGFTEEEVRNWQNGTSASGTGDDGQKDVRNVKWTKKGEDREWDRGKVLEGEFVEQRAEWGRLKD